MKISLLINELNICGGTHKQLLRLSQYLLQQGHDVTIFTRYFDLDKTYPEFKDVKIEFLYKEDWTKITPNTSILNKIKNKLHKASDSLKLYLKIVAI